MKTTKIIFTVCCLLTMANSILAQRACDRWYFDANYTFIQPLGAFETNGFHQAHGVSFGVYYDLTPYNQKINFHLGGRVNAGFTKGIRNNITLADPEGAIGKTSIYNALGDFKLVGRAIFLPQQRIKPYLELFAGGRVAAAHETLKLDGFYIGYEEKNSEQLISGGSGVIGAGGGLLIKIHDVIDFDLRLSYNHATNAEYVDLDSYLKVNDNLTYDFASSEAKNYALHIGFRFKLGCGRDDRGYEQNDRRRSNRIRNDRNRRSNRKGRTPTKKTPSSGSSKS